MKKLRLEERKSLAPGCKTTQQKQRFMPGKDSDFNSITSRENPIPLKEITLQEILH